MFSVKCKLIFSKMHSECNFQIWKNGIELFIKPHNVVVTSVHLLKRYNMKTEKTYSLSLIIVFVVFNGIIIKDWICSCWLLCVV